MLRRQDDIPLPVRLVILGGIVTRSYRLNCLCRSLHIDGLSTLSCTWASRLSFGSVVLIFVDLGGNWF